MASSRAVWTSPAPSIRAISRIGDDHKDHGGDSGDDEKDQNDAELEGSC